MVAAFGGGARVAPGAQALEDAGLPRYPFPERTVAALGGMALVADRRRRRPEMVPSAAIPAGATDHVTRLRAAPGAPGILELEPLLRSYGIRVAEGELAASAGEAACAAARIGFPVALKAVSPEISHKTEIGGVRLGLTCPA